MSCSYLDNIIKVQTDFLKLKGFTTQVRNIRHLFEPNIGFNEQRVYLGNDIWILTSKSLPIPPDAELFIASNYEHLLATGGEFNCLGDGRYIVLKGEVNIGIYKGEEPPAPVFFDFLEISPLKCPTNGKD